MEATTIARQLALGGVLTVAPGLVTRTWGGESATGAALSVWVASQVAP